MILNDILLDEIGKQAKESPRLRMNYNFHDLLEAKAQRLLNALEVGTVLPIHRHVHTSETYILLRGRIRVMFYNNLGAETDSFLLNSLKGNYGVHIPKGQWHTLEVLEAAVILEVKDGPYAPIQPEDLLY